MRGHINLYQFNKEVKDVTEEETRIISDFENHFEQSWVFVSFVLTVLAIWAALVKEYTIVAIFISALGIVFVLGMAFHFLGTVVLIVRHQS
jgi:hypothetical protein